jgi:acetyl-CoA carboxylase biotin carboxyl carrier protein
LGKKSVDLKDIKTIVEMMKKNELNVFQLEKEGFKLLIEKGSKPQIIETAPQPQQQAVPAPATPAAPAGAPAQAPETGSDQKPGEDGSFQEILSPMVGTFYSAQSPDHDPYVEVGDKVTEDTVVCILEAMKVMNEIKAEIKGTVAEVLAENGKPVQYGQPLFRIKV